MNKWNSLPSHSRRRNLARLPFLASKNRVERRIWLCYIGLQIIEHSTAMLGLLLIFFIGRSFFRLAETYNKHKWGFAILGIASYYGGVFLGALLIGVILGMIDPYMIDDMSDIGLGLMCLPLGLLTCWGVYKILQRNWKRTQPSLDLLDSEVVSDDAEF